MRYLFTIITILSFLAATVAFNLFPGHACIKWFGYQVEFPVAVLICLVILIMVATAFLIRTINAILFLPQKIHQFLEKRRINKAEKMLLEGLTALAADQIDEAQSCIAFAQKIIPKHPLTAFVTAESAKVSHDSEQAKKSLYEMTKNPSISFLGYKGLIQQSLENQEWHKAHQLLTNVFNERPDSPWVIRNILKNILLLADTAPLPEEIKKQLKYIYRPLPKQQTKRHEALVLWLQSQHVQNPDDKRKTLQLSHDKDPSILAVTHSLVASYIKANEPKQGRKIIKRTLSVFPHRSLYQAWKLTYQKVDPALIYIDLEKEISKVTQNIETTWLLMQAALEANMWGQAEKHAHELMQNGDDRDVCLALAQIYSPLHLNNPAQETAWQARALDASSAHMWVCKSCSMALQNWQVICPSCHDTDTARWKQQSLKTGIHVAYSSEVEKIKLQTSTPYEIEMH